MKEKIFNAGSTWFNGIFITRMLIGYMFLSQGIQVFQSDQMEGYVSWSKDLGFNPPWLWAYAGKAIELVGGLFLMLGLFTRLSSVLLVITMAVITFVFHEGKPFSGDEHPFLLLVIALVFFLVGPGKYSVDYFFFSKRVKTSSR